MDPVDEIKQKIDIVDLVGGYVDLKKAGRNYKGMCPFHNENTPSMMVSPELQIFKCFGCGEGGDIFSFHQKIEGIEFTQSLGQLAEKAGVKIEKRNIDPNQSKKKKIFEINEKATKFYSYLLLDHKVGKKALDYLKKQRELKPKTIKDFNLGYSPDSWDSLYKYLSSKQYKDGDILASGLVVPKKQGGGYVDKFRGRIMFPFVDVSGKIVGFSGRALGTRQPKYLNTPETLVFHKSIFLYGLEKAKVDLKKKGAVFVEGQLDVITAHQNGIDNVIASSGTSLTVGQLKILARYTKDITFAFDSDAAGINAIHRAIELSDAQDFNVNVVLIPEKHADLDEFVKNAPKEAKKALGEGIPVYDFFLISAMRKHNITNPIGKKKAMQEIASLFNKISDPVLRDHYIKKVSDELDISENVVASLFIERKVEVSKKIVPELEVAKKSIQEYILALLLRAPLEIAQTALHRLGQRDFTEPELEEIFVQLKKHLKDRKNKFDVKKFEGKLEENLRAKIAELYLWDFGELLDREEGISKELDETFEILKKKTAKRELKMLSAQIKEAEVKNDDKLLKSLSKEFKELSEKLL